MRYLAGGLLAMSLVFGTARWANAACDLTQAQLDAARAAADAACDAEDPPRGCTTATSHGQYVACFVHQVNANPALPRERRGAIKWWPARPICGQPARGFVACGNTSSSGTTTGSTRR